MRRFFDPLALAYGAVVALACAALSWALALLGFGNAYYLSVFLPFSMLACLAVAWFAFLRSDGFGRRPGAGSAPEPRPAEPLIVPGLGSPAAADGEPAGHGRDGRCGEYGEYGDAPGALAPDLIARPSAGLIERRPLPQAPRRRKVCMPAVLAWAAFFLGLASIALYRLAGVGSSYFL